MSQERIVKFAEIPVVPRGSSVEAKPLLLESSGAQSFVSGISTFPAGAALKSHAHNTEEMVVLLEGEATVEVGDRQYALVPYDTSHVPAGLFHRFLNRGATHRACRQGAGGLCAAIRGRRSRGLGREGQSSS